MLQKWPDNLIIIRHGQSARNVMKAAAAAAGRDPRWCDGVRDQDTPLTAVGEMQAIATGVELRKRFPENELFGTGKPHLHDAVKYPMIDAMFVSPYLRTRQTADKIVEGLGYSPKRIIDERIREIEFGLLDGLSKEGIAAKYPEEVKRREKEGKYYYRAPGGESRPDVKLRVRSFIDTIVRDWAGRHQVVVVCHSVVVLAFRAVLERWDEDHYMQIDREDDVKNCSITHYQYGEDPKSGHNKLVLQAYNSIFYREEC
jgi:broad specificity phosphatase PhoE